MKKNENESVKFEVFLLVIMSNNSDMTENLEKNENENKLEFPNADKVPLKCWRESGIAVSDFAKTRVSQLAAMLLAYRDSSAKVYRLSKKGKNIYRNWINGETSSIVTMANQAKIILFDLIGHKVIAEKLYLKWDAIFSTMSEEMDAQFWKYADLNMPWLGELFQLIQDIDDPHETHDGCDMHQNHDGCEPTAEPRDDDPKLP